MALENLEEELYKEKSEELSRRAVPRANGRAQKNNKEIPIWTEEQKPEEEGRLLRAVSKIPFMRKWVIAGVVVAALVLVGVGGFYFYLGLTAKGVLISIQNEKEVMIGVPTTLTVTYSNSGQSILKDAKLAIALPEGISFVEGSEGERIKTKVLGDVGPGSEGNEEFRVIALRSPQSVQTLTASIDYVASKLGSRFKRDASASINLGDPAINVSMSAPQKVLSGEEFQVAITYSNVSNYDFSGLQLRVEYPPTFSFGKSSIAPSEGNYLWNLGDLRAGSKGELVIKGSAVGKADSSLTLPLTLSAATKDGKRVAFKDGQDQDPKVDLSISPSPLPIEVSLNNRADYIASPGEQLSYAITYHNNTEATSFRNVVLTAQLTGDMYDFGTVNSSGFFSSVGNVLTWSPANTPAFSNLGPGESGSVTFSVLTKSGYPIKRVNDKNFTLKVKSQIQSPTVPSNVAANQTISVADMETKVRGKILAEVKALFRDADSGILNAGPIPPRVNATTNYTIHWLITNFSNDAENVVMRATLQSGVTFTGQVKSNIVSVPTYNPSTQEMTWTIDRIAATKGVLGKPVEATFQVAATPSVVNVNQYMPLVSQAQLTARDAFTGLDLSSAVSQVTTFLTSDPTVTPQQGIVVNQ